MKDIEDIWRNGHRESEHPEVNQTMIDKSIAGKSKSISLRIKSIITMAIIFTLVSITGNSINIAPYINNTPILALNINICILEV